MEETITKPTIIIKESAPRHGGAWKVAYADFVTAMMAFFLLMWLLNATTEEQKAGIANYFDPTIPQVSKEESGAGGVMGGLTMTSEGTFSSDKNPVVPPHQQKNKAPTVYEKGKTKDSKKDAKEAKDSKEEKIKKKKEAIKEALRAKEIRDFRKAVLQLRETIKNNPKLKDLAKHLKIDMTPEGLRIQIIDQDGKPMFPSGSAQMFDKTKTLIAEVATAIETMPNELSIRGHTDSVSYGPGATYTNWELSADRANATRRVLKDEGIPVERLNNVQGKAATEPLLPEDPTNAQNRRISIILIKEELTNPNFADEAIAEAAANGEFDNLEDEEGDYGIEEDEENYQPGIPALPNNGFQRSPGVVDFP